MTSKPRCIEDLFDRAELQDLVTVLTTCLDSRDFDGLSGVYTPDATLETPAGVSTGAAAIVDVARSNHEIYAATQHFVSGVAITQAGAEATVTADVLAVFVPAQSKPGEHRMLGSRYTFQARKARAGWRFHQHVITPIWAHRPPADQ
ncbi:nuclear transport factor 2 family protein [Nocardia sp. NPDC050175]|uniref:nuclear transport factor 2 family protein n=1 Tax=Nocardia sp. NPDC050175 TaxID=3364317 RepID=UPI0037BA92A2